MKESWLLKKMEKDEQNPCEVMTDPPPKKNTLSGHRCFHPTTGYKAQLRWKLSSAAMLNNVQKVHVLIKLIRCELLRRC